jgi:hypothetical protein
MEPAPMEVQVAAPHHHQQQKAVNLMRTFKI